MKRVGNLSFFLIAIFGESSAASEQLTESPSESPEIDTALFEDGMQSNLPPRASEPNTVQPSAAATRKLQTTR